MWRASESAAGGTLTFSHRKLSSLCQCSRSKRSYTAPENNHRWQVSPVPLKLQMYLPKEATRYWKQTYQEDQTVQEQSVEESNGPGHLVGENHTSLRDANNRRVRWEVHTDTQKTRLMFDSDSYQAQSCFIPGAEAEVSALTLLKTHRTELWRHLPAARVNIKSRVDLFYDKTTVCGILIHVLLHLFRHHSAFSHYLLSLSHKTKKLL